ncbi:hypothetical protein C8J57DRAFT_1251313 [Mycena rebaudengoi]|nr:hypothetical protein C8J57DRAFT_1251313 [Mycena rebaudengoi]
MNDCVHLNELLKNQVVAYDEETGKLRMRDGTYIRKQPGESLVEAARWIAMPHVMFGTCARLIDEYQESDEHSSCQNGLVSSDGDQGYQTELYDGFLTSDTDSDNDGPTRVYLSVPRFTLQDRQKLIRMSIALIEGCQIIVLSGNRCSMEYMYLVGRSSRLMIPEATLAPKVDLEDVQSPRRTLALEYQPFGVLNVESNSDLADDEGLHGVETPDYPPTPSPVASPVPNSWDSDDSVPSLVSIQSREDLTSRPRQIRFYSQPNININVHTDWTADDDAAPINDGEYVLVPTESLIGQLNQIRHEFPYDLEYERQLTAQFVAKWNRELYERTRVQQHKADRFAVRPIDRAIHTIVHILAGDLDDPGMELDDLEETRRINALPADTSSVEIIRAQSRLVRSFVDFPDRYTYPPLEPEPGLRYLTTVSSYAPGNKRKIHAHPYSPPAPHNSRSRIRTYHGDALRRGIIYRAAAQSEFNRKREIISALSDARAHILEGLFRCEQLVVERKWPLGADCPRDVCLDPLPVIFPEEQSELSNIGACFNVYGNVFVADTINQLLRLRFQEATVISHLLYGGYLDIPRDAFRSREWEFDSDHNNSDSSSEYSSTDTGSSSHEGQPYLETVVPASASMEPSNSTIQPFLDAHSPSSSKPADSRPARRCSLDYLSNSVRSRYRARRRSRVPSAPTPQIVPVLRTLPTVYQQIDETAETAGACSMLS